MKLISKLTACFALLAALTLTSCEKEKLELNVVQANGVSLTLVPEGGGETKTFTISTPYTDEAGNVFGELKSEDIVLEANTTYNATIVYFSDKTGTRLDQNESIKKEDHIYTLKYVTGQSSNPDMRTDLAVVATDKKANGSPLGLQATVTTGKAGVEFLNIELNAFKSKGKSSMGGSVFNASFFVIVQD